MKSRMRITDQCKYMQLSCVSVDIRDTLTGLCIRQDGCAVTCANHPLEGLLPSPPINAVGLSITSGVAITASTIPGKEEEEEETLGV